MVDWEADLNLMGDQAPKWPEMMLKHSFSRQPALPYPAAIDTAAMDCAHPYELNSSWLNTFGP